MNGNAWISGDNTPLECLKACQKRASEYLFCIVITGGNDPDLHMVITRWYSSSTNPANLKRAADLFYSSVRPKTWISHPGWLVGIGAMMGLVLAKLVC